MSHSGVCRTAPATPGLLNMTVFNKRMTVFAPNMTRFAQYDWVCLKI